MFMYTQHVMRLARASVDGDEQLVCSLADSEALKRLCSPEDKVDAPVICAARTPPAHKCQFKKREGARKVKRP